MCWSSPFLTLVIKVLQYGHNVAGFQFHALQCGDFYETIGLDAVVVMQYASLNPMGKKYPQAGAPLGNITQLLRDLVQGAGFSVVSNGSQLSLQPQGSNCLATNLRSMKFVSDCSWICYRS